MTSEKKSRQLRRDLIRIVLFGTLAVLCVLAVTNGVFFLAGLLGMGAVFKGKRLLDRKGIRRRELWRWARENARELGKVAREDRIAASQMKRLEGAESLLSDVRAELLALDTGFVHGSPDTDLARLKGRVAYFRQSMDEVARSVERLPAATTERLPAR